MSKQTIEEYLTEQIQTDLIPTIKEFIKIPNQSRNYDPEWETNKLNDTVCDFAIAYAKKIGVATTSLVKITEEKRTPCVLLISEPKTPGPTILMYGHLDKQPPMTEQWTDGLTPYDPIERDGKLYGRGSADDGYAFFTSALILKALQQYDLQTSKVVLFFETDEESGSKDLVYFLDKHKEEIGVPDLVICLDSGCADYDHMCMTTTLRGVFNFKVKVEVLKNGVHSGMGSGIIPDSFRIGRKIIDQLEVSDNGQLLIDELYVNVPEDKYKQAYDLVQSVGGKIDWQFPFLEGVHPTVEDGFRQYMNRIWMPQLTLVGVEGIPEIKNAGNVLRPSTTFGFSLRLPPTLNQDKAKALIQDFFENKIQRPYNAKVELEIIAIGQGFNAPQPDPLLVDTIQEAAKLHFKNPALFYGEGGSIPFINELYEKYPKSQFIVTGVLGPMSNAHGPNEFLHLDYLRRLTLTLAHILKIYKK